MSELRDLSKMLTGHDVQIRQMLALERIAEVLEARNEQTMFLVTWEELDARSASTGTSEGESASSAGASRE